MRTSAARASASSGSGLPSISSARASSFSIAASSSDLNTSTRARDSSAALSSKDGFSVVAPTSTMVPSSITGRKRILLRAVEAVDLVDEQQRALAGLAARAGRVEHLLQVGDAGEDRRDLLEFELGLVGEQARHRGLAGAGRPPEDQRAERARLQHAGQRAVGAEQMILADDLRELGRPQLVGQRPRRRRDRGRRPRTGWSLLRTFAHARAPMAALTRRTRPTSVWPPRWMVMRHSRLGLCGGLDEVARSLSIGWCR